MVNLVFTIIGPDRVGLVHSLSEAIASHGGNWVESRLAQLCGQFAGMVHVVVPEQHAGELSAKLRSISGMHLVVEWCDGPAPQPKAGRKILLDLVGADHPGIVHDIAHVLAAHGLSFEELDTECIPAPMSGDPMFQASAVLHVPHTVDLDALSDSLEQIAADLMVELSIAEPEEE